MKNPLDDFSSKGFSINQNNTTFYVLSDYSSSSRLRRFTIRPRPVTAAKAPRSTDDLEASVPVFGNCCLDLSADSEALVDADSDALVLADWLALVDADSEADVLADWLALVDADWLADVLADWLALVDADSEALVLAD